MGMFGIAMDLMRDWRNTPGLPEVLPFLDKVGRLASQVSEIQGGC